MPYIKQFWCTLKCAVEAWFEWQDAKYWAKEFHPAWVQMATKGKFKETRQYYKLKILAAYRGTEDG